jgi:hypothetical protein
MHTTQFNQRRRSANTGPGDGVRAGSWLSYGLGTESADLPARRPSLRREQPRRRQEPPAAASCRPCTRASSSGRAGSVLFVSNLDGVDAAAAAQHHRDQRPEPPARDRHHDPEVQTRIAATSWRIACRPACRATDIRDEPASVHELHGATGQGVVRQQLPAGAAAGRARLPLRPALSPRLAHGASFGEDIVEKLPRCASRPTRWSTRCSPT